MDINQTKILFEDLCNKNQKGGYSNNFNSYAERAQLEVIDEIIGNDSQYQLKIPVSQSSLGLTQKINDALDNIVVSQNLMIDSDGFMISPSDYRYFSSLRYSKIQNDGCTITKTGTKVKIVPDQNVWAYQENSMYVATKKYPIAWFSSGGINFLPTDLNRALLTYVKTPKNPFWGSSLKLAMIDVSSAGTGYIVGDVITITGGVVNGTATINQVSSLGGVLQLSILTSGSGYTSTTFINNATGGSGTGLTLNVDCRPYYDSTISQNFEISDMFHNKVLYRMCYYTGIRIRETEFLADIDKIKQGV